MFVPLLTHSLLLKDQKAPQAQFGDIWQLGEHRLMCGDGTDITQVKKLMEDRQADLVFTDPPYNVNYQGRTANKLKLRNDNLKPHQWYQLIYQAFAVYRQILKKTASLYIFHSSRYQREMQNALEANGFEIRNQIIWAKQHFVQSFARYKMQHEVLFYCHNKNQSDFWYGEGTQTTLWCCNKPRANRLHPTMKPVMLAEKALKNSSRKGDVVFDGFAGAGSTLIACEQLERKAYLIEIEPCYVDVIIARWQNATGKTAILLTTQDVSTNSLL